jgi:hypothetical protein
MESVDGTNLRRRERRMTLVERVVDGFYAAAEAPGMRRLAIVDARVARDGTPVPNLSGPILISLPDVVDVEGGQQTASESRNATLFDSTRPRSRRRL